jgi:DNA polymerase-3 subunit alpha
MGIKVLPPDVNASAANFAAEGTDVRFGLAAVRNVGTAVVEAIIAARDSRGRFTSLADFLRKAPAAVCNKRVIESLVKSGAFDSLGQSRRGLMLIHEQAIDSAVGVKRNEARGQDSLFGGDDPGWAVTFEVPVPGGEWDKSTRFSFEREMLGLYVSDHPLLGCEAALAAATDSSLGELLAADATEGRVVTVAGILSGLQRKVTRQGASWASAMLEDLEGAVEVLFFPATYQRAERLLADDAIVVVRGRLDREEDAPRLVAMDVTPADFG